MLILIFCIAILAAIVLMLITGGDDYEDGYDDYNKKPWNKKRDYDNY